MTSKKKLLGIQVVLFIFVMMLFSCDDGNDNGIDNSVKWTTVEPFLHLTSIALGSSLNDIAWGNNKFVAVGDSRLFVYSEDGITWTQLPFGQLPSGRAITWGNNKFVAVGYDGQNSRAVYSEDGITWTNMANIGTGRIIRDIAWGNNKFVAVGGWWGNDRRLAYSEDGITFIAPMIGTFRYQYLNFITWCNSRFFGSDNHFFWHSYDGITWTRNTDATISEMRISGVAWGNNKYVAVGSNGHAAYSEDGITWTAISDTTFGDRHINSIAWGSNKFVAVGNNGHAAYSEDGIVWTAVSDTTFQRNINSIVWGNNKFVAVGDWGSIAYWDIN
jgi:hypothetical protein